MSGRCCTLKSGGRDILLHELAPRIAKQLSRPRCLRDPPRLPHHLSRLLPRIRPILEEGLQAARKHLLKPHHHHTVRRAMADQIPHHVQPCRTGGTIVVDVVDRDLGHAELVEDALAAGGVAIAVAGDGLVDLIVVDAGVEEGFYAGFKA